MIRFEDDFQNIKNSSLVDQIRAWFQACLAQEEAYGTRFLFVSAFLCLGAIGYFYLDFEPKWESLVLFLLWFGVAHWLFRNHFLVSLLCSFMVFIIFGVLCAKIETVHLGNLLLSDETLTMIEGRIRSIEQREKGGYRLILDEVRFGNSLDTSGGSLQITARKLPKGAVHGATLKGFALLQPPYGPIRPDSYHYAFHAFYRSIQAQGVFLGQPSLIGIKESHSFFKKIRIKIAQLRHIMTERIQASLPGESGSIAAALITGQRAGISDTTNEALRISGLFHILSISGLHMTMVSAMVFFSFRAILGLFPIFSSRYPVRKMAAFISLFVSAFYLLLSGNDIAAQRSFIMVAVMLGAILWDRSAITMRNLSIALILCAVFTPHEILSPGFQMSFVATAGLVAVFGWWNIAERAKDNRLPSQKLLEKNNSQMVWNLLLKWVLLPLFSTAVGSLIAGTSSGLYALFHFNTMAPLTVVSNVLACFLMSLCVMPFALLAVVFMPFYLEFLPLQIMGWGIENVKNIAFWVTAISPEFHPGFITATSLSLATIGFVLLFFLQSSLRYSSLIFFSAALFFHYVKSVPLVFIAEQGMLVGVSAIHNTLVIDQKQSSSFVVKNWEKTFASRQILEPNYPKSEKIEYHSVFDQQQSFQCDDTICRTKMANGKILTVVRSYRARETACKDSDIVFFNFNGNARDCAGKITINRKQLALYGSLEIRATFRGYQLVWASGSPSRFWNRHRLLTKIGKGLL